MAEGAADGQPDQSDHFQHELERVEYYISDFRANHTEMLAQAMRQVDQLKAEVQLLLPNARKFRGTEDRLTKVEEMMQLVVQIVDNELLAAGEEGTGNAEPLDPIKMAVFLRAIFPPASGRMLTEKDTCNDTDGDADDEQIDATVRVQICTPDGRWYWSIGTHEDWRSQWTRVIFGRGTGELLSAPLILPERIHQGCKLQIKLARNPSNVNGLAVSVKLLQDPYNEALRGTDGRWAPTKVNIRASFWDVLSRQLIPDADPVKWITLSQLDQWELVGDVPVNLFQPGNPPLVSFDFR